MSRSLIIEKLRLLHQDEAPPLPSEVPPFPADFDPVERFKSELEQVSGIFLDGRSPELLKQALEKVLKDARATEIYWESEEMFARHRIPYRLRDEDTFRRNQLVYSYHPFRQVDLPLTLHSRPYTRETLAKLIVSASSARCGIAETGTVVEATGPGIGRLLPVLPPVHVAFLCQADLLMNHAEFFARVKLGEKESYQVLVTGPSRTADIEKTLVLGVHGPRRHYVVLTP
ncbi:MAG TPA: LUD domain-containing protein [Acidobacteriota bacterium]|nr:LUD domain-containing protein [Acidobacteriota bacterium]